MTAQRMRPGESPPRGSRATTKASLPPALERNLGQREREIMAILWKHGRCNVQQVSDQLSARLAYTTVMTTLDRLFKKGLLLREKMDRAFVYSTAMTAREMEGRRADGLIRRFFSDTRERPEILVSCLVDAMQHYDRKLLDTLESRIHAARTQHAESRPGTKKGS